MQQDQLWRWVYRDPTTGRIRTDGHMTELEAMRFPGAMRIPGFGSRPRAASNSPDFQDTQAGTFRVRDGRDN